MQSKKRQVEIFKCFDFDVFGISPQFSLLKLVRIFFVAFGQKEGLCDLILRPLNFFLCLGFVIIYHQIQVSHHEIAHEFNLHLHQPFIFHVFLDFVVSPDLLLSNSCKFCP
jgi:hypothetical protein